MKRQGNLYPSIISFENLARAEQRARRGKRNRAEVAEFRLEVESNLLKLSKSLEEKSYEPGQFHIFQILDPKIRTISAPPFRDRIVHHALCSVIEPIFEKGFIFDSYSCRKGKGPHQAMDRLHSLMKSEDYVLHGDIRSFFPTIDHDVMCNLIRRKLKCPETMWLCDTIIRSSATTGSLGVGLPIGSLTSQLFANVVLDPLDHFVKEVLGCQRYIRYCDDFLLISPNKAQLADWRLLIKEFLQEQLKLTLHPSKQQVYPTQTGVPFLGFRHFPNGHRRLNASNGKRFCKRLRRYVTEVNNGSMEPDNGIRRIQSWQAHANHGHTLALQNSILSRVGSAWVAELTTLVARGFVEQQQFQQLPQFESEQQ